MALPPAFAARVLFSYQDAAAMGISVRQLDDAVRNHELMRLRRGWFTTRKPRLPSERHSLRAQAELLHRQGDVVLSHTTAALLLGLPVRTEGLSTVHLSWTRHGAPARSRGGVCIHQLPIAVRLVPGAITMAPALICVQTAMVDPASGLMAADRAIGEGLTTKEELTQALQVLTGLSGARQAAPVIGLVDRRRESPGESELAYVCHVLGHELEPQVWLAGASGRLYRVDAVLCRTPSVIAEYDGEVKYSNSEDLMQEKRREDDLRAAGYEFVRVTKDLLRRPSELDRLLRRAADRATRPSHR